MSLLSIYGIDMADIIIEVYAFRKSAQLYTQYAWQSRIQAASLRINTSRWCIKLSIGLVICVAASILWGHLYTASFLVFKINDKPEYLQLLAKFVANSYDTIEK